MLTFEESASLINDAAFRGRVKVACLSYAGSILAAPPSGPASNSRFRWAQSCYQNPDITAAQVTPPTVMNVNVQIHGGGIDDQSLLASVQYVVEQML